MKRVGIIGAGRFGLALAESLANAGLEVILIDRNRPAMQTASEFATALQGVWKSRRSCGKTAAMPSG